MREVKPEGARIYRDKLYGLGGAGILAGSAEWQAWLAQETTREFMFRDAAGEWHHARREWRRGRAYWYVSCRVKGPVRRFYLGPAGARCTAPPGRSRHDRGSAGAGSRRLKQAYCCTTHTRTSSVQAMSLRVNPLRWVLEGGIKMPDRAPESGPPRS